MKRLFLLATLACGLLTMHAAKKQTINKIEPANWYVGMKNPKVQLMVYGNDIAGTAVSTATEGVKIDSVVCLDSKNYLFLYLDIADAKPGNVALDFVKGKAKNTINYPLLSRDNSANARQGFSSADVLYMLMPDRFANGDKENDNIKGMNAYTVDRNAPSLRHGGDLEGIRKNLDYFADLGVTALWFTPVLENNSPDSNGFSTYHGYATTDYYRVDPRFGTNDEYIRLVKEAHEKGLKVVMDMIFNHSGLEHPWLSDLPNHDWLNLQECVGKTKEGNVEINSNFKQTSYKLTPVLDPYASKVDKDETTLGWFVSSMPDLNQHNPHLMTYLIQNSIWWIEQTGIDGIRMDTYPYAFADGMAQWMARLEQEYPCFKVVGETWVTEPSYTAAWQEGSACAKENSYLNSVMDFSFFDKINMAKTEDTDEWWNGMNRIYNSFVYDYLYPNPSMVMAFVENHDTDRFLGEGRDSRALKQALALLLTANRIPQLYYGTEVMMNGTKTITDGNVRKDMPGFDEKDAKNAFTGTGLDEVELDMLAWTKTMLKWRKQSKAVTEGRMVQFIPYKGVYVLARIGGGKTVLTVINGTSGEAEMHTNRYAEVIGAATEAIDIPTGKKYNLESNITLAPRESLVLEF